MEVEDVARVRLAAGRAAQLRERVHLLETQLEEANAQKAAAWEAAKGLTWMEVAERLEAAGLAPRVDDVWAALHPEEPQPTTAVAEQVLRDLLPGYTTAAPVASRGSAFLTLACKGRGAE